MTNALLLFFPNYYDLKEKSVTSFFYSFGRILFYIVFFEDLLNNCSMPTCTQNESKHKFPFPSNFLTP